MENQNVKEQRIIKITQMYYSRKDIQDALFKFSKNREVVPRYMMKSFGKRPDSLQYPGDIFELVKNKATSFHCSEELWKDALKLSTGMDEKKLNELRMGWDLLLDIDSKYLDYSRILAEIIIKVLRFYGVKNFGIKFSGSKGFHIIVPWKAFPKEINKIKTSDMFPKWPRILTQFIRDMCKEDLIKNISKTMDEDKYGSIKKYIKGDERLGDFAKKVMPDLILVSPRHLFRMPYSLHEKTALSSAVVLPEELRDFQPKDADPLKIKVRNFMPEAEEGEATELLREALDWYKNKKPDEPRKTRKTEFEPIQISDFSEEILPPAIKKILKGVEDGRKRSLFVLINLFRSLGMNREEVKKRIHEWNEKNTSPLDASYIKSQLLWSYRNKGVPPPNYDKEYYEGMGISPTEEELRYKNPISYILKKRRQKSTQNKIKNKTKKKPD